ncbi:winged helix-turn-helix domain-containing protein [Chitinophaga rhizophila]|nr:winged helix-turn-helix domain-containing protein [Chitinophaga rhizophila]
MITNDKFNSFRREVRLRQIGHELLRYSSDSTSRVLPVKKIDENEYQISFENPFTFQPESLVNATQHSLAKDPLADDYVVSVLNCSDLSIAYGYAMSKNKKDDIITCIGRRLPKACYMINIKFRPTGIITAKNGYFLGSLTVLAFVGFIYLKSAKPRKALSQNQPTEVFDLGSLSFDAKASQLLINGNTIDLTKTETRILRIFALSPNEIIARSRLQKEIWEDEGVIVGRSLDMFISKLRKKLESDPNIRIVVIRGKGYRLEFSAVIITGEEETQPD